jgi:hypothetical protein
MKRLRQPVMIQPDSVGESTLLSEISFVRVVMSKIHATEGKTTLSILKTLHRYFSSREEIRDGGYDFLVFELK